MNSKVICFLLLAMMAHIAMGGGDKGPHFMHMLTEPLKEACGEYFEGVRKYIKGKAQECKDEGKEKEEFKECMKDKMADLEGMPRMEDHAGCEDKMIELLGMTKCEKS